MKKTILISLLTITCLTTVLLLIFYISNDKNEYENITISEFEKKVKNTDILKVYVYKTECNACQSFRPIINKVVKDKHVKLYAINIGDKENNSYDFFEKYNIQVTPTMMIYKNGKLIKSHEGVQSEEMLTDFLH